MEKNDIDSVEIECVDDVEIVENFEDVNEDKLIDEVQRKIKKFYDIASNALFERDELVRLIVLAIFAKDHLFLYGPPGSAKSVAAQAMRTLTPKRKFFKYLMTDYTKYEEIFGKEVAKLGETARRLIEGKLPTAEYGFLDEIFKATAEILNSMLTILNEREYDDDYNGTIKVPICTVIAASNEFPRTTYLKALFERFPLRIPVPNIKDKNNRIKLMNGEVKKLEGVEGFSKFEIEYIYHTFSRVKFSEENGELLNYLIDTLHVLMNPDDKKGSIESIYEISGRTIVKIGSILRLSAYINRRESTDISDLLLLRYIVWNNIFERGRVLPKINQILFGSESEIHGDVIRELETISTPIMRYIRSLRMIINGSNTLTSEKEYNEYVSAIQNFIFENMNITGNLKIYKEKIEECKRKEVLIRNNIFLHAPSVLEWTVEESLVEVNSNKFIELIGVIGDYSEISINDNGKVKYKLEPLVAITISIFETVSQEITKWINTNDSFLSYRVSIRRDNSDL